MRLTLDLCLGLLPALRDGGPEPAREPPPVAGPVRPDRETRYGGVDEDVTFDPPPGAAQPKRPEM